MQDQAHWTEYAHEWIAWASTPGLDAFWAYRQQWRDFVGLGTGDALEVGCGEGRVSRELRSLGYRVTATDPVAAMVDAARKADSAEEYVVASGSNLPFKEERFDLVMAYNVLMDVEDVPATVREMRRVLRPGGVLLLSLVHPFVDRGGFAAPGADAPFVLKGSYFGRTRFEAEEAIGDRRMHFAGWSQPLESYMAALEGAGLAVVSLREPTPDEVGGERLRRWGRMPLFLWLKARPLR